MPSIMVLVGDGGSRIPDFSRSSFSLFPSNATDRPARGVHTLNALAIRMSDDYAEKVIAEMTRFDGQAKPMPRWFRANREASFALLRHFVRSAPPRTIHHYTSSAALIPIVTNSELWLSEATFLNDRHEIELGRRLACSRVEVKLGQESSPEVRAMLERTLSNFERWTDPQVYVACFSYEADDLTQWRAYGGDGTPVAIELELSSMMFGYTSEGFPDRVIYNVDDQEWVFDQLLTAYADAYRADVRDPIPVERSGPPLKREVENEIVARSLYHALWRHIVTCKDQTFASEREVRFIYTAHDFSQHSDRDWYPKHPVPRFREHAGRVIPYLSSAGLEFSNMERVGEPVKLPIKSVRIGPTAEPLLIERGIRRLLDTNGYENAAVTISTSPFRPR